MDNARITARDRIDWDAVWTAAEIRGGRNGDWRQLMSYRTKRPDDAVQLAAVGWSPEDVRAARERPLEFLDATDVEERDGVAHEAAVARLVLAEEVARWHESSLSVARSFREQYVRALAAPPASWSHQRIGDLIGLTKQRIQAIVTGPLRTAFVSARLPSRRTASKSDMVESNQAAAADAALLADAMTYGRRVGAGEDWTNDDTQRR